MLQLLHKLKWIALYSLYYLITLLLDSLPCTRKSNTLANEGSSTDDSLKVRNTLIKSISMERSSDHDDCYKPPPAPAYVWSKLQREWVSFEPQVVVRPTQTIKAKVGVFNIFYTGSWLMDYVSATQHRWKAQLETIFPQEDFDILCLNEVATPYLELLLSQPWIRDNYFVSDIDLQFFQPRGNLIMWKKTVNVAGLYRESGGICRRQALALAVVTSPSTFSFVTTVHLSAFAAKVHQRRRELAATVKGIARSVRLVTKEHRFRYSGSIFLGDFNFHTEAEGAFAKEVHLIDCWRVAYGTAKEGFTLNSQVNRMLKYLYPKSDVQMRLDRVYLQAPTSVFTDTIAPSSCITISKLNLFATEPIAIDSVFNYIWPSDHFGIKLHISLALL